jgi:pimeloyl-ACP methyl ester carboxylesterase
LAHTSHGTLQVSDHQIDVGGAAIFARRWRPWAAEAWKPVIVLIHDSLGCVELWRTLPEELARATQMSVIAYDRLGFGQSDRNPQALERDFIAREAQVTLPALCAQLDFKYFIAFGHSVGGAMAVACAAILPDTCLAVITESAQAFVESRTLDGIREAKSRFEASGQLARLTRYHGEKAQWVLDAWTNTWLAPSFATWTLDSMLALVRCPLLGMHGDRDEFGSPAQLERIVALARGPSTATLMQGCGHVPHREFPDRVIEFTTRFLAEI